MNQANENQDVQEALLAAFTQAVQQGEEILASVLEKNPAFFKANSNLNDKVVERIQKGRALVESSNYRAADVILRHAIDLILQEDHRVFKDSADLRADLLRYRDYHQQVITPLWQKQRKRASES